MVVTFLYTLGGGMLLVMASGNPRAMAWNYLRTIGAIVLALGSGATLWVLSQAGWQIAAPLDTALGAALAVAAAVLVFAAPLMERAVGLYRGLTALGGAAGIAAACLHGLTLFTRQADPTTALRIMAVAGFVAAALLLGSITVAWLLGHAYLTQTRMTIAPLRHFSRVLLWAVGIRTVFLLASLALGFSGAIGTLRPTRADAGPSVVAADAALAQADRAEPVGLSAALAGAWLMLSLRIGLGLVAVGIFAWMVAECVKIRSTQSATGILYFASLFAIIGELASQQFIHEIGWPL